MGCVSSHPGADALSESGKAIDPANRLNLSTSTSSSSLDTSNNSNTNKYRHLSDRERARIILKERMFLLEMERRKAMEEMKRNKDNDSEQVRKQNRERLILGLNKSHAVLERRLSCELLPSTWKEVANGIIEQRSYRKKVKLEAKQNQMWLIMDANLFDKREMDIISTFFTFAVRAMESITDSISPFLLQGVPSPPSTTPKTPSKRLMRAKSISFLEKKEDTSTSHVSLRDTCNLIKTHNVGFSKVVTKNIPFSTSTSSSSLHSASTCTSTCPSPPPPSVEDEVTPHIAATDENLRDFELPHGFITPAVAEAICEVYRRGGRLSNSSVNKLLRHGYKSLKSLPNTTRIYLGPDDKLTIVGDIHGQIADLLHIIEKSGPPSASNIYIFNGDFVDRGPCGVEVVCVMLAWHLARPGYVVLNRGNHEDHATCCAYGFRDECISKYDELTFYCFCECFVNLPLFAIVNDKVLVLHGGLFHSPAVTLDDLDAIDRTDLSLCDLPPGGEVSHPLPKNPHDPDSYKAYLNQIGRCALWSDPSSKSKGIGVNSRGAGIMFGDDITKAFLQANDLKLVVRSHECVQEGFDQPFSGRQKSMLCTVFSATDYGGRSNKGAFLVFTTSPPAEVKKHSPHRDLHEVDDGLCYYVVRFSKEETQHWLSPTNVPHSEDGEGLLAAEVGRNNKTDEHEGNHHHHHDGTMTGEKAGFHIDTENISLGGLQEEDEYQAVNDLYSFSNKLPDLFKFFDQGSRLKISSDDFADGYKRLFTDSTIEPPRNLSENDCDCIFSILDVDEDEFVDLNEFFEVCRLSQGASVNNNYILSGSPRELSLSSMKRRLSRGTYLEVHPSMESLDVYDSDSLVGDACTDA